MILQSLFTKHIYELMLIAISIYVVLRTRRKRRANRAALAFHAFAEANLIFQIGDLCMTVFRGEDSLTGVAAGCIIYILVLMAMALVAYLWFRYVEEAIGPKLVDSRTKRILWTLPLLLFAVLCVTSPWTGWIFRTDENGKYALGSLFFLQYVFIFGYCLVAMVRSAVNYFRTQERHSTDRILLTIMIVDLACVAVQLIYMVNVMPMALLLTALLSYMNVFGAEMEEMKDSLARERTLQERGAEQHRDTELQLRHQELRGEVLNYMVDHDDDPIELLKNFAERIRVLIDCDQVIYRDLEETRIMVNSPAIEDSWHVPFEYCLQCQHLDPHHPMYAGGYTEMENCQEGWQGIPVYHDCPIKSSLTRIVYCDGEIAGYLAIHYVQKYHRFTDLERSTLEEFTRILSISLSRYTAKRENRELKAIAEMQEQLKESTEIIGGLASEYLALYYINMDEGNFRVYSLNGQRLPDTQQLVSNGGDPFVLIRRFADSDAVHPDDRQLFAELSAEKVRERLSRSKRFSVRFRRNYAGEYLWSEMDVVKYGDVDERANVIAIGFAERDKEIRREMEAQARLEEALEDAQVANRAKTSFLFNMSHDIRTPMNAILGYTDVALRHGDDPAKVDDSLRKIRASGGHLLSLINDILEMSRIEAGKLELTDEPLDIREAVRGVENMSMALAIPKSIRFEVRLGDIPNPYILADELHLNEVFINIISNAMKYSREDGTVSYAVDQISGVEDGKAWYRVEVADNGIGMSEEFLGHIYETFAREKSSTVSKLEGAGLGLSIVKRIVDLAGGRIDIRSRLGEGTTVTVELPFRVMDDAAIAEFTSAQRADSSLPEIGDLHGKRVLLVEDNEMNREIAEEILAEAGLEVETAEDGSVAVRMVSEKGACHYDFILMDIQMPVMNGYEATKAIRRMPDGCGVPIIAVSANAFEEDRRKSLEAGMNAHVAKPINVQDLFAALARQL